MNNRSHGYSTKLVLSIVAVFAIFFITVGVVVIERSVRAEHTLGAYYLTLDLVACYVERQGGTWPKNWEVLRSVEMKDAYGGWEWPRDIELIKSRINVDFLISSEELAVMKPGDFKAITQVPPNYGPNHKRISKFLQQCRSTIDLEEASSP